MKLMIDLETLALTSRAHVLSVGYAFFDSVRVQRSDNFLVAPEGQELRERDSGTVLWWLKQAVTNPEAAQSLFNAKGVKVPTVLNLLRMEYDNFKPIEVWANSPSFDCEILRDMYRELGQETPWKFRDERDFRTLKNLRPDVALPKFVGAKHNAKVDAVHQAKCAIRLLRSL